MRKRLLTAAIVLAMGSSIAGLPAAAAKSQTYGDLTYINYGGWVEILDCAEDVVSVEIPEKIDGVKVRDIGDNAFSGCKSLIAITIPDCIETIGERAFSSCSSLTSITLPDSVKTIEMGAFLYCSSLETLELPPKLETIGRNAFVSCTELTEITIPKSVTSIGERTFCECFKLSEIHVEEGNTAFSSVDGVLFDLAKTELLCYPSAKTGTAYTIPESVNKIGLAAFYTCVNLEEITIPETVTSIEGSAFYYCTALKQMELPETIQLMDEAAFYGCTKMTAIYLPASVTEIGLGAFGQNISLTDVYYGGSQTDWAAVAVNDDMQMNDYFLGANFHFDASGIGTGTEQHMGDVNADGKFSVTDLVMMQKYLLCTGNLTAPQNADMCADGTLDAFDLAVMKRELLRRGRDAEPMLVVVDDQIYDYLGWTTKTFVEVLDSEGFWHVQESDRNSWELDIAECLSAAPAMIGNVTPSDRLTDAERAETQTFLENAAQYEETEMTAWDFGIEDYGQENLYALYPDGNGGYHAVELCRFGGECAWLDNADVQAFVTMLIENGYYADEMFFHEFLEWYT